MEGRTAGPCMEQKSFGGKIHIAQIWHYGAAIGRKRMDDPYGSADPKTGADQAMDHAKYCAWSRLCQLLQMENSYDGNGNILAWYIGLFRQGEPQNCRNTPDIC